MENQTALLVSGVMGAVFALLPEVVPGFTKRWDALSNDWKKAVRSWAGLLVLAILALLNFVAGVDFGFGDTFTVQTVIDLSVSWAAFVLSAEGLYQASALALPRKRS